MIGNVPRYFIAEVLGERELGIFAAMFYLTIAGSTLMGAIAQPATPRLAKLFSNRDMVGYRKLLIKLITIAVGAGTAGLFIAVFAGGPILTILYTAEYAEHISAFIWLMAATIPMYAAAMFGVGINAMRRFHVQVPLPTINLIFTLIVAALLMPRFELVGAGQVVFLSGALAMVATFGILVFCLRQNNRAFSAINDEL